MDEAAERLCYQSPPLHTIPVPSKGAAEGTLPIVAYNITKASAV